MGRSEIGGRQMRPKVKSRFIKSKEEKEGKEKKSLRRRQKEEERERNSLPGFALNMTTQAKPDICPSICVVSISVHACMPPPSSQPIRQCQTSYTQHQYVFKHFQNGDFADYGKSMKKGYYHFSNVETTTFFVYVAVPTCHGVSSTVEIPSGYSENVPGESRMSHYGDLRMSTDLPSTPDLMLLANPKSTSLGDLASVYIRATTQTSRMRMRAGYAINSTLSESRHSVVSRIGYMKSDGCQVAGRQLISLGISNSSFRDCVSHLSNREQNNQLISTVQRKAIMFEASFSESFHQSGNYLYVWRTSAKFSSFLTRVGDREMALLGVKIEKKICLKGDQARIAKLLAQVSLSSRYL
ncbi:hypothetical protein V1478_010537 [Vespula squamosa]|uniref:Uncharacterized protein n=1 Tax=Vespula squamosa TaxID=30214 RepID=A0ABD2AI28_VESSQ